MTVFEMAKQYYPRLWDDNRIDALVAAGKLTAEDAEIIINSVNQIDINKVPERR